ncbi:MAG: hypothetical protein NDJ89_09975 [Oligoflexia bacterium]|nr:hypothetical protein [Oligoflexia bacterium]
MAYFPERSDSDRLINLALTPGTIHRLSIVVYGKGFNAPGVAHIKPTPVFALGTPPPALFESSERRDSSTLFLIISSVILSAVLLVFGLYNSHNRMDWPISLAVLLIGFSLARSLHLDHVQSSLNSTSIQAVRQYYFALFMFFTFRILRQLCSNLWPFVASFFRRDPMPLDKAASVPRWTGWIGPVGTALLLGYVAIGWFINTHETSGLKGLLQYELLKPLLDVLGVFGWFLVIGGTFLAAARMNLKEDEEAHSFSEASKLAVLSGASMILYVYSYNDFLFSWIRSAINPTSSSLLKSQSLPIMVSFAILFLMAAKLREQRALLKVIPDSIQQIVKRSRFDAMTIDHTATEYNWLMLNDISGSSAFKLTHLAILTHILQSIFHKIHKDYFRDSIHFINSLGDAMLIAIKSPARPRHDDPILEKLVRSYSLHVDGIRAFRESYSVLSAVLSLENKELYLALQAQAERRNRLALDIANIHFRTILTINYYFYGLNHDLSNIDSKSIYVMAKSEKLLAGAEGGGFIVFPDLMRVLETCFEGLGSHFERCAIDKSRAAPGLRDHLPDHAFALKVGCEDAFEAYLEGLYGGPLYLRRSATGENYVEVSAPVRKFCAMLQAFRADLPALVKHAEGALPKLQNFSEKNHVLKTLSEAACAAGIWEDRPGTGELHERLQALVRAIGVPTLPLIQNIKAKDRLLEPAALLRSMGSSDPIERNRAVRFAALARVKNPFRPGAMPRTEFYRGLCRGYLERFEVFSVESHLFLLIQLKGDPELTRVFAETASEPRLRERTRKLQAYLSASPARSVRGLPVLIREMLSQDSAEERKAG